MTRFEIFQKVESENARSKAKHGMWRDLSNDDQFEAIRDEYQEWNDAWIFDDTHGEHGEIAELIQLINVCCRRLQYLTGEDDA